MSSDPDPARRPIQTAALLFLAVLAVYSPAIGQDFVSYDDPVFVTENPVVRQGLTLDGVRWAFGIHEPSYHPLAWLSHMLDASLWGDWAGGHKLVNLLLHATATAMLFIVLRRMTRATLASAAVAFFFGVHPLRVESVAWVSERKDVLAAFFAVATLLAYEAYHRRGGARRYAAVLACFTLGLLSKPMVVTLPAVLLLLDYWPLGRTRWWSHGQPPTPTGRLLLEKAPMLALSLAASWLTILCQRAADAVMPVEMHGLGGRLLAALSNYGWYLRSLLFPRDLAVFYPLTQPDPKHAIIWGCVILLISALLLWHAKRNPAALVGWLWFLGMLVPVIGVVQVGGQSVADRYAYLPHIGLFIAIAFGAQPLLEAFQQHTHARRIQRLAFGAALTLAAASLAGTIPQVLVWQNTITLFEHADRVTKDNGVALHMLGLAYADAGRLDESIITLERLLQLQPDAPHIPATLARARRERGVQLAKLGDWRAAAAHFARSAQLDPSHLETRFNLALACLNLGNLPRAEQELKSLLAASPNFPNAAPLLAKIQHLAKPTPSEPAPSPPTP